VPPRVPPRVPQSTGRACSSRRAPLTSCASCASCSARSAPNWFPSTTPAYRATRSRTARRFEANAAKKARFFAARSGLPTLADDSGIEVEALGGGPGVRTRRYAGEDATDEENNVKLLRELAGLPPERRSARYRCALALALPEAAGPRGGIPVRFSRGTLTGRIAVVPRATVASVRPNLRAGRRTSGGRTLGEWTAGGQEPHLPPRPGRPAHARDPGAPGLLASVRRTTAGTPPLAGSYTDRYTTPMDNRSTILARALELWSERGYDAVGVQEIVDAAGITKPTLYHYFGSKRGLLDCLIEERSGGLRDAAAAAA